ncbi:MAG: enoyl-ACP reductase [Clostridia bacterium]|nr:enoyl-[acyl-carrier-protein] reductase FabI [Bacillota bacterium]MBO2520951.1 enoyl-[acyl-carrier-protein] reductase FabI [Bacillota bacterium]
MDGKKGVVLGVTNKRSIAWGITQVLRAEGAEVALTYQGKRVEESVRTLAAELDISVVLPCDVTEDAQIDALFAALGERFGKLDFLVHSIAFAPKEALEGEFVNTSREAFRIALDVSAYSLVALARGARPLMKDGGSIVTLTYYGAEKAVPGYNVMGVAKSALESAVRYLASDLGPEGIRVNAISAGPVNTVAARGISGFTSMLKLHAERAPLRRNVTQLEVGQAALYLLSDLGSAVTGEVLHVDAGYHAMGM